MFPKIGWKHPKWMFFFMENPYEQMDDLGGPLFFRNIHTNTLILFISFEPSTWMHNRGRVGSGPRLQWDPRWQREAWGHRNILGVAPLPVSQWHILGFCHWCLFSGAMLRVGRVDIWFGYFDFHAIYWMWPPPLPVSQWQMSRFRLESPNRNM